MPSPPIQKIYPWSDTALSTSNLQVCLLLWQPLVTMTDSNTSNKSLSKISSKNHKRTQQRVSAELLPYLYKLHMVHATNNYSCTNVHVSSMSTPCIHHEVAIQLTHSLMSSI